MIRIKLGALMVALALVVAISFACAAPEPTPTPIPPVRPAQPTAPTPIPAPTVAVLPATPTPVPLVPTPTRAPATPTPVVKGKPVYGGILRWVSEVAPDTLDPAHTNLFHIYEPGYAIYEGLLKMDYTTGASLPSLAERWETSPDGKVITFYLRKGVKFQDGTDFNAQAVKWNYDRMLDPNELSQRRAELGPYVDRVEAADAYTFVMRLKLPYRPLLPLLASDRPGMLVSPAAVAKYGGGKGGDFGKNPVGTGPFRFVRWVVGDHILMERNNNYWDRGKPYLDSIRLVAVRDLATGLAMLRTGEAETIYKTWVRAVDLPLLNRDPNLKTIILENRSLYGFVFNISKPPFDNRALRQAISYSLDRETFVKVGFAGQGRAAYTMEGTGWAHNPEIRPFVYDTAKAKQKLAEAGYSSGVTVNLACIASPAYQPLCEMFQAMAKEVGITLNIVTSSAATYWGPEGDGLKKVGFKITSWAQRADPDIRLRWIFYPGGFYNVGGYSNPEVTKLLDQAVTVYDLAEAKKLYDRIQAITAEEAIWVYGAWTHGFAAMRANVHGYLPRIFAGEHLETLWIER